MPKETECKICKNRNIDISETLGVCINCIRNKPDVALKYSKLAHKKIRDEFNLPTEPHHSDSKIRCNFCANECSLKENERGYCGLRENKNGKMVSIVNPEQGLLHYYYDPIPTNCCSSWFCPGGTGNGYPRFSYSNKAEYGYLNLSVFFYGCSFDCIFCQNWSHKEIENANLVKTDELVEKALNRKVSCICYFGGSPEPQLPFAINVSEKILEESKDRIMRICWEWNGSGNKNLVRKAAELSLESGGNIKFDLKVFDENLSLALSGVSNKRTLENFEMIGREFYDKRDIPVLTATTLLVPRYVDEIEVENIAKFISNINEEIPYSLLVFHPDFYMSDMPITPKKQVDNCYLAAKKYLKNVNVGNTHLLL